jgi:prolycopene isomerase
MIDWADEVVPGLRKGIKVLEIIEPERLQARTGVTGGAMYGWASRPDQMLDRRLPQTTPVPGLFLAGQWTSPGAGMVTAMSSGQRAARLVQRRLGRPGR